MIFDITSLVIFCTSAIALWFRLSQKVPELVAIPDALIQQQLQEESAKLHLIILNFRTFWKERHFLDILLQFAAKLLYKIHIGLLRIDNRLVSLLQRMRVHGAFENKIDYWKQLQQDETAFKREVHEPEITVIESMLPPSVELLTENKSVQIQEIRKKRKPRMVTREHSAPQRIKDIAEQS